MKKFVIAKNVLENTFGKMSQEQYNLAIKSTQDDLNFHYHNPTMQDFMRVFETSINMARSVI